MANNGRCPHGNKNSSSLGLVQGTLHRILRRAKDRKPKQDSGVAGQGGRG